MTSILIVEDDTKLCELLQAHLEKYGYTVYTVTDFSRVMEEFRRFQPKLVLLDVNSSRREAFSTSVW